MNFISSTTIKNDACPCAYCGRLKIFEKNHFFDTLEAEKTLTEMNAQEEVKQKRNNLNGNEKRAVFLYLSNLADTQKKLPPGLMMHTAEKYSISTRVVQRIWKTGRRVNQESPAKVLKALSPKRKTNCGRKKKDLPLNTIREVPHKKRRTVRSLAAACGVKTTTLQRALKDGRLKRNSNPLKPKLTDKNELERVQYCVNRIIPETIATVTPLFDGFYNCIHVDEKWFYMLEENQRIILLPDEIPPHRTCQSKRFIGKVMFLCAVARPRFNLEGEVIFDGKIGIWPFVEEVAAKRSSANRPRGTLELKPVDVDRDIYREYLTDELIPAILTKYPDLERPIFLQQDNARPHIYPDDETFLETAAFSGLDIQFMKQPPNSPDLNICDLSFFRAIQALQQSETSNTVPELIANVKQAFNSYSPIQQNKMWITYQQIMLEVMRHDGSNKYQRPHMGKDRLHRLGQLEQSLTIPVELLNHARSFIEENENN